MAKTGLPLCLRTSGFFDSGNEEEYLSYCKAIQIFNPTALLDFSNPNRVEIDLTVTEPAMCWS